MIDVLTDLKSFAALNDLSAVAAKIEEAISAARAEFGMLPQEAVTASVGDEGAVRQFHSVTGAGGRA